MAKNKENASKDTIRPQWIVVFQEPDSRNISEISKLLGAGEAKDQQAREGCTVLSAPRPSDATPRIYEGLGVASLDMNEEQRKAMEKSDLVYSVSRNERRFASSAPTGTGDFESSYTAGQTFEPNRNHSATALSCYFKGARDVIEAAGRFEAELDARRGSEVNVDTLAPRSTVTWGLAAIGLHDEYSGPTGKDISVAVLDTGIDPDHPDFAGRIHVGTNAISFVPDETVRDGDGHGTHVAGTVGANRQSAGGIRYSVAPEVDLLIGKVLNDAGEGWDDQILDGMDWAARMGARVISMSLGGPREVGAPFSVPYERIASQLFNRPKGVLVLAAAGNGSRRPREIAPVENPAACPSIFAIGAVDENLAVAEFSAGQRDPIGAVDLCAPGVRVHSSWRCGGFRTISGTSMATPHVAGVAALYLERHPDLTIHQIWGRMRANAKELGRPRDFGRGLVQVPA